MHSASPEGRRAGRSVAHAWFGLVAPGLASRACGTAADTLIRISDGRSRPRARRNFSKRKGFPAGQTCGVYGCASNHQWLSKKIKRARIVPRPPMATYTPTHRSCVGELGARAAGGGWRLSAGRLGRRSRNRARTRTPVQFMITVNYEGMCDVAEKRERRGGGGEGGWGFTERRAAACTCENGRRCRRHHPVIGCAPNLATDCQLIIALNWDNPIFIINLLPLNDEIRIMRCNSDRRE